MGINIPSCAQGTPRRLLSTGDPWLSILSRHDPLPNFVPKSVAALLGLTLAQTDERARIVAILHDVVEDTPITYDDLAQAGFDADIIAAVEALTKRPGEKRMDAAVRAKANPLALQVKLADVADNMNLARIGHPTVEDYARLREYEGVLAYLKQE